MTSHDEIFPDVNAVFKNLPEPQNLNILMIGGTGFVGSQLTPELARRGHAIENGPRAADVADSALGSCDWRPDIEWADVVVLLTVINNDQKAGVEKVTKINVDLPLTLATRMSRYSGKHLILFGSDHTRGEIDASAYARSKFELLKRLKDVDPANVTMLSLSPVYGDRFVKKLAMIDKLPGVLRDFCVAIIGAFRPLTHVGHIADAIEDCLRPPGRAFRAIRLSDDQDRNPVYRLFARTADLAFAFAVGLFFSWLMLLLFVVIPLNSPGPAIFRQKRIGQHGREFNCYKFRTMRKGTKNVASHEASPNAITPLGRYLRNWKLDELPQIWNIVLNQMSLVGPRPCLASQHQLVCARQSLGVLAIKPGITGFSQVKGIDMSNPQKLAESDAEFLYKRSIFLYLKIVLLTFFGRGNGDPVIYHN